MRQRLPRSTNREPLDPFLGDSDLPRLGTQTNRLAEPRQSEPQPSPIDEPTLVQRLDAAKGLQNGQIRLGSNLENVNICIGLGEQ